MQLVFKDLEKHQTALQSSFWSALITFRDYYAWQSRTPGVEDTRLYVQQQTINAHLATLDEYHPVCLLGCLTKLMLLILAFIQNAVCYYKYKNYIGCQKSFVSFNFVNIGLYKISLSTIIFIKQVIATAVVIWSNFNKSNIYTKTH